MTLQLDRRDGESAFFAFFAFGQLVSFGFGGADRWLGVSHGVGTVEQRSIGILKAVNRQHDVEAREGLLSTLFGPLLLGLSETYAQNRTLQSAALPVA